MATHRYVFHPAARLLIAVIGAVIFATLIITFFSGEIRTFLQPLDVSLQDRMAFLLIYDVPISIPFVLFLFDRLIMFHETRLTGKAFDLVVLIIALARAFKPVPLVSGHALFLTYALFTSPSRLTRAASLIVLIEVAYFKILLWKDSTIIGGFIAGLIAAYLLRKFGLSRGVNIVQQNQQSSRAVKDLL